MLATAIFTRNDSRVSKTSTRQFAERAICTASPDWAGAFAAKRIRFGSCNCAHRCVHSPRGDSPKRSLHLRRIRRLWLNSFGGGVKQKADSGRGQACSNSIIPARRRLAKFAVYFGHFRINDHFPISRLQGHTFFKNFATREVLPAEQ